MQPVRSTYADIQIECDVFADEAMLVHCGSTSLIIKGTASPASANLQLVTSDKDHITVVGVACIHRLRLVNTGDTELTYLLKCKVIDLPFFCYRADVCRKMICDGHCPVYEMRLDKDRGSLPSHGSIMFDVTMTMWGRAPYTILVSCYNSLPKSDTVGHVTRGQSLCTD